MIIAGLSFYDEEIIAALCGMENVDAVVLGDLFCGKRMFGDSCLLAEMMENVHGFSHWFSLLQVVWSKTLFFVGS